MIKIKEENQTVKYEPQILSVYDTNLENTLLSQDSIQIKEEIKQFIDENHILNLELNETQKKVLDLVEKNENIFFTGSAGTGKSVLIHHIVYRLFKKYQDPTVVAVTSTTGISALQIQGITIHRWSGIGYETEYDKMKGLAWGCEKMTRSKFNDKLGGNWKRTKVLIIDEISMLNPKVFDYLNFIAKEIRGDDRPFGGIQIIASGDFFQLSPVKKQHPSKISCSQQNSKDIDEYSELDYCFEAKTWDECFHSHIQLTEVYRQVDKNFSEILNSIRTGDITWSIKNTLQECRNKILDNPTRLFATNEEVNEINELHISKLNGQYYYYKSHDSTFENQLDPETMDYTNSYYCDFDYFKLFEDTNIPSRLEIKEGCKVMLTANLDPKLVNGLQGTIVGFRLIKNCYEDYHTVYKDNKKNEMLENWLKSHDYLPYVEFENGQKLAIPVCLNLINISHIYIE